ncbi:MAG: lipoate--protein ligase [Treponema sp.]|jgi:lipoate-protein ligase A|nr:lipoate--protein ligase [Treponema sp.]
MIERIFTVITDETNPYRNIALEALLLECLERDTCILYLWQNRHTVVIGRNQNAWKECRVEDLEASGGFLARRLSGGGAVYHDLGNLNFTFLIPKDDYDTEKQSTVILRAVQAAGIDAYKSGRNDIETGGRKFSGNAFYFSGNNAYHHGTLLVSADLNAASQYLTVHTDKIKAKGIESVRKRMINLTECSPNLTIPALQHYLTAAFDEVYRLEGRPLDKSLLDRERLSALEAKFADPEWKYGKNPPFQFETGARFAWGDIDILIDASENRIAKSRFFSDAMDEAFILALPSALAGVSFTRPAVQAALTTAFTSPRQRAYCDDIIGLIFRY